MGSARKSAEYHTNNLLSSVLFEETTALLPNNSLTIEVAPHRLLQGILKQSMSKSIHIGLTQRGAKENVHCIFNAFGQ
jgi:fatty acid synthase, animal type